METTWTVSALNREVARALNGVMAGVGQIQVRGELSEVRPCSGRYGTMVYFALKDGEECLGCISYGRALDYLLTHDIMTGEVFSPPRRVEDVLAESRKVVCRGRLTTYTKGGRSLYQLLTFGVAEIGMGEALRRLRELKERLARLGYFAEARKRPLPVDPRSVGLVTARTGAAIHDFLKTAQDRGLGALIQLYSVRVQGGSAPAEIAAAIRQAGRDGHEVIVLTRGGGSADDLACFNDEGVARAIFESPVPVLAAIGHEVDVCIAEMTADVRASTPTMAASMLWTPRKERREALSLWQTRLRRSYEGVVADREDRLLHYGRMLSLLSPRRRADQMRERVDDLAGRLGRAADGLVTGARAAVDAAIPEARRALETLVAGAEGDLSLAERGLRPACAGLVAAREQALEQLAGRLGRACAELVAGRERQLRERVRDLPGMTRFLLQHHAESLEKARLRLEAVNPVRPLERGFALLRDSRGRIVREAARLSAGERLGVELRDGRALVTVEKVMAEGVPDAAPDGARAAAAARAGGLAD